MNTDTSSQQNKVLSYMMVGLRYTTIS